MRVVHVISSVGKSAGGTAEIVPKICSVQQKAGIHVTLACRDIGSLSDTAVQAQKDGVTLRLFNGMSSWLNKISFSWDMMRNLGELVRDSDIVHLHGGWLFAVWWGAHCARKYGKAYVIMPHGSLEPERLKISKWKKRIVGWLFDRRVYRHASAVWVTAESEGVGVRRYGVTCPIHVVPLGLDVEQYERSVPSSELLSRLGVSVGKKVVLYFSRITKIKGLDLLAQAWSSVAKDFPDWQLVVAGPDDYHGYRAVAEELFGRLCPTDSYRFTGPVYGADKYSLLKSASVFVLPTRNENFSIAVQESLASGVPVVCTKGAPWQVLETAKCGCWTDVSAEGIASGLRHLMGCTGKQRTEMGTNGNYLIRSKFSWAAITADMVKNYEAVLCE
jgi:glycosyltransferase involved in cell wall biosynthesis